MEMRAMIARFAQSFDAQLAPGFSPERFEASIKVCTAHLPPSPRRAPTAACMS
jgi:hypothetical protein